jgi:hypothetical protein
MPPAPSVAAFLLVIFCLAQVSTLPSNSLPDFTKKVESLGIGFETSSSSNFTMTIDPLSQTVRIGEQAFYQITLSSANGFAGQISLRAENFPQELLKSFSSANVTLISNRLANSTLTINTISVGEEAFYEFTIVATSGGITQRVSVSLTVLASIAPPSIVSYAFLAAVLLFAAFIIWYGLRARRLQQQPREEINEQPKPPPV